MKFYLDDLEVLFPYEFIYPEQYHYIKDIKKALDAKGHCLLEMPSGTGKTVCLLSLIVAYQSQKGEKRKLIYCSRTVPEIEKALAELKRLMEYRKSQGKIDDQFLGLGLSSRKNLCVHDKVSRLRNGSAVDAQCRNLTAPWIRSDLEAEKCSFYENLETVEAGKIASGVYTLEEFKDYGMERGYCPYYMARRALSVANVIIYSYHYLLDPKVADSVSKELSKDAIVVFDEAHNIDNVCTESLSIDISRPNLDASARCITELSSRIQDLKLSNSEKLQNEYTKLVEGLKDANDARVNEELLANPLLSNDILTEAVPGNIRKAEHFVAFLRRFVEYLKTRFRVFHVIAETPLSFLLHLREVTFIEQKPLKFCAERLGSLIRTLEITDLKDLHALQKIASFATLLSTYQKGFILILEPFENDLDTIPNPVLHFTCLDATLAIKPVFDRFSSVIITSGTLSPLELYPTLLGFEPKVVNSYQMTLLRTCFLPLIITRGSDQVAISSKFQVRNDIAVVRNYGNILLEFAKITPDGLVAFFPSYLYMESIVSAWNEMGMLQELLNYKLVFVETPDAAETSIALENYRSACDNGRGAVLLSVARGKVSEGVDFDHQYGRTVILFGIPYQYTESRILKARLEYLRDNSQIRENDFLSFDAIRHGAQCVGRVIRGKQDYGLMVFADKRFARADKRSKLPKWIVSEMEEACTNLSTDMALSMGKQFFKTMAQKLVVNPLGVSLWNEKYVAALGNDEEMQVTGSVLIKCEKDNTVAWLLETVTERMQLRQLSSPFEKAYREDGTCLANDELLEGLAEEHPAILLLQSGQIDNLPPIAQSFFTDEALERLGGSKNSKIDQVDAPPVQENTSKTAHEELLNLRQETLKKFSAAGKGVARRTVRMSTVVAPDLDAADDKKKLNRLSTLWDKLMIEENQRKQTEIETTVLNPTPLDPSKRRVGFNSDSQETSEPPVSKGNRSSKIMLEQMDTWIGEIDKNSEVSAHSIESAGLSIRKGLDLRSAGLSPENSRPDIHFEAPKRHSSSSNGNAEPSIPPPLISGPPPPPPPPALLAGPPPPPPPPMLPGGPPPPRKKIINFLAPIPGTSAPTPAPASGGDLQNELMSMLANPSLRKNLRKVTPRESPNPSIAIAKPVTTEETEAQTEKALADQQRAMAEERENLVMEMLGFMETPNGSIEDLVDKCTKQTSIARGFIYTLVRRSWVKAFRLRIVYEEEALLEQGKKRKHVPCTVFPGIQWTSAVELPDEDAEKLSSIYPARERVGEAHMYRFDQSLQKHLMDTIVFYKSSAFPPPFQKFIKPEPPQDASLENRNKWEIWNRKKQAHMQSDSAQYDLIWNKLRATEQTLESAFGQLEITITQIREMNAAVSESFRDIPLPELRKLVLSIPSQIKKVAQKLHETNGIIIKDTDLKLTPAFIKSLSNPEKTEEVEVKATKPPESRNNRTSFVSFGGLPMETVLPLLQSLKAREERGYDKKASRRFTLW